MPSTLVSPASPSPSPFLFPAISKIPPRSRDISLLRGRAGRCTPGDDFCAAETAISAPAKLNCCSRGGERMAARGPAELRERRDGDKKRAGKRIAPRRRFHAGGEIAMSPEVALNSARSRRRSYANSKPFDG